MIAVCASVLCPMALGQGAETKEAAARESKGLPARATPGDYQSHVQAGAVTIAAEFAGHAVPTGESVFTTEDYVAVEVALFGPADARTKLSFGDFSLRVDGKKVALPAQPYGLVFGSLKDPDWSPPDKGESKSKSSFGGGGKGEDSSPPPVVHMPIELVRAMQQKVQKASFPEGDRALPEAGLIFFQHRGKVENIRSLELIYAGPAGKASLALQP